MHAYVCTTCGVAYPPSDRPPAECRICTETRQYVNPEGQGWITFADLQARYRNDIREQEPDLFGIGTAPQIGIGQRALFIAQPKGGVVWDCTPLITRETVDFITARGGVRAIALSHPHFYASMAEWSDRLGAPVYIHEADRQWAMRPAVHTVFWSGERLALGEGITLVRCRGHFEGSAALHWAGGAGGRGALFTADTVMVTPDPRWMSFMRSYPIAIPLNARAVRHILGALEPFPFDRIYGGWWDRVCRADARARLHASAERYIAAIS